MVCNCQWNCYERQIGHLSSTVTTASPHSAAQQSHGHWKKLLVGENMWWINRNGDIENMVGNSSTCLNFQQIQQKDKIIPHEIWGKLWQVVGTDLFNINNSKFLCIIVYHSKFLIVKQAERLSADSLKMWQYWLPRRIM